MPRAISPPTGSPAGVQATATLTDLMKGKTVTCE